MWPWRAATPRSPVGARARAHTSHGGYSFREGARSSRRPASWSSCSPRRPRVPAYPARLSGLRCSLYSWRRVSPQTPARHPPAHAPTRTHDPTPSVCSRATRYLTSLPANHQHMHRAHGSAVPRRPAPSPPHRMHTCASPRGRGVNGPGPDRNESMPTPALASADGHGDTRFVGCSERAPGEREGLARLPQTRTDGELHGPRWKSACVQPGVPHRRRPSGRCVS